MDKITCNVIGDLLPLYVDDVLSEDTKGLVEGHLAECEECAEKYAQMKREIDEDIRLKAAEAERSVLLAAKKKDTQKADYNGDFIVYHRRDRDRDDSLHTE